MHEITADRLHQQHAYFEDGISHAMRRAGAQAAADAAEAACRVMDAADPDAPLHMLAIARDNLARHVRRHALGLPRHHAA